MKVKLIIQACLLFFIINIITGIIYPIIITGIARLLWPEKSAGSLVREGEIIRGSELIAQKFTGVEYFWPRPSAGDYNANPSSASNLGPTSQALKIIIKNRRANLLENAPDSLLTSSASGIDPHLNLSAIKFQMPRIINARKLDNQGQALLEKILDSLAHRPWLSTPQATYLNVLMLNIALDQSFGKLLR
jgi:K+-transporting ATPase ATPase C chain